MGGCEAVQKFAERMSLFTLPHGPAGHGTLNRVTPATADSGNLDGEYSVFVDGTNEASNGFGYRFAFQGTESALDRVTEIVHRPRSLGLEDFEVVREVARIVDIKND